MSIDNAPHVSQIFPTQESPKGYAERMLGEAESFSVGRPLSLSELETVETLFDVEVWRRIALGYRAMCLSLLEQSHQDYLKRRAAQR